ncbi:MAG: transposase [Boseongicola sp. SB0675_bin_26]|nr:transposase [Boseongicola sp. SB0675_bin_26]
MVQFAAEVEDRPFRPAASVGINMDVRERDALSTGETVPAVRIGRRPPERAQRAVSRAKRVSDSRRRKVKALARERERTRIRERDALHGISAGIVKRRRRIAAEALQVSNMMRHPTLARPIAERQWGRLAKQLTCEDESARGEVVRVRPRHTGTDCHACGHRRKMPLGARELACDGCGLATDRDVNAARNVLRRGIAPAGRESVRRTVPARPGTFLHHVPPGCRGRTRSGPRPADGWSRVQNAQNEPSHHCWKRQRASRAPPLSSIST